MKDLFTTPADQPEELKSILKRYEEKLMDGMDYTQLEDMLKEVNKIGFTFDYYLDAEPYGLRPIGMELNELEGFETI